MQDTSDQFATPEEEAAFHEEIIATDNPTEEVEEPENDESDVEEPEEESEPVQKKKPGFVEFDTPEQKARVAQITREKHELDRKLQAANARLAQLEKPPEPPKEVPVPDADPLTNPDLFARQQQDREKYIRDQIKFESDAEQRTQQKALAEQQKQAALLKTYQQNITRLKVNPDTLHKASEVCTQYGISNDLVEYLLEDQDGPAIVTYLGDNVDDLAEIVGMKPAKAAAYIERQIRAKLNVKKQSKAPPPATKVNGTRTTAKGVEGWSIS